MRDYKHVKPGFWTEKTSTARQGDAKTYATQLIYLQLNVNVLIGNKKRK